MILKEKIREFLKEHSEYELIETDYQSYLHLALTEVIDIDVAINEYTYEIMEKWKSSSSYNLSIEEISKEIEIIENSYNYIEMLVKDLTQELDEEITIKITIAYYDFLAKRIYEEIEKSNYGILINPSKIKVEDVTIYLDGEEGKYIIENIEYLLEKGELNEYLENYYIENSDYYSNYDLDVITSSPLAINQGYFIATLKSKANMSLHAFLNSIDIYDNIGITYIEHGLVDLY